MTREERKNVLHCLKVMAEEEVCEECDLYGTTGEDHCEKDCVRMAIKALEQEPCEDAISREAALEKLNEWDWQELYLPIHFKEHIIDELPSVTPKPTMQEQIEKEYLLESIREDLEKLQAENDKLKKQIEPCEDAISRREALKCLNGAWGDYSVLNEVFERIDKLPSVTPSYKECRTLDEFIEDSKESEESEEQG